MPQMTYHLEQTTWILVESWYRIWIRTKVFCEEMFGRELDVMEELEEKKSQAKQHRDWLHECHGRKIGMLRNVKGVLKKM